MTYEAWQNSAGGIAARAAVIEGIDALEKKLRESTGMLVPPAIKNLALSIILMGLWSWTSFMDLPRPSDIKTPEEAARFFADHFGKPVLVLACLGLAFAPLQAQAQDGGAPIPILAGVATADSDMPLSSLTTDMPVLSIPDAGTPVDPNGIISVNVKPGYVAPVDGCFLSSRVCVGAAAALDEAERRPTWLTAVIIASSALIVGAGATTLYFLTVGR